ncbi:MAG: acyl-CoA dehydrogenase family protein [Pseudomonadota bacterium]
MDFLELDLNLNDEDLALKQAAHKFAKDVMRPVAAELDQMTPEEVIAPTSPLWDFMKQAYQLGYHAILIPESYGGMNLTSLQQIMLYEELSWGSSGLAVQLAVASFPAFVASLVPEDEIVENIIVPFCECRDASIRGCWGITEPDHGSDTLIPGYPSFHDPKIPANCKARRMGDEWVISGQKSAWVSGGTIATHCALFCQVDPEQGHAGGGLFVVPLDLPGVSKGKPLNKLGQRDLNQGEVYFDEVRIPASYQVAGPEAYEAILEITLSATTALMGALGTGVARAAFEEALGYAKERVQGGKRLIQYPNIQMRLFHMLRRVEAARQITRAAYIFNQNTSTPAEEYSVFAKIQGTEASFQNAHEAIQIFGGNGLAKEYVIERLFRDARAMLVEDGSNDTLAIAAGHKIIDTYPRMG